jgi:hypothetical protein
MKIEICSSTPDGFRSYGHIEWAVEEDFTELINHKPVRLIDTKAVDIVKMTGLSITSKILLSAVAGAIWQHILDLLKYNSNLPAYDNLFIYFGTDVIKQKNFDCMYLNGEFVVLPEDHDNDLPGFIYHVEAYSAEEACKLAKREYEEDVLHAKGMAYYDCY